MKSDFFKQYNIYFWLFVIGSFLGFFIETTLTIIKGNFALRKGLIYEPLIPVYGVGIIIFYLVVTKIKFKTTNKCLKLLYVFLLFAILGGSIEFIFSYLQEKIFGTISWDYSKLKFDLFGRTSLFHAIIWGILGIAFYLFLYPNFIKWENRLINYNLKWLTLALSVFLIFDINISIFACARQNSRDDGILPHNKFETFLDRYYPDERIKKVYNNAKKTN